MSIEKITARILGESTERANLVIADAEKQAKEILNKANAKAKEIADAAVKNGDSEAVILVQRKISVAELDARKMQLGAKQEAVAKCFDVALEKMADMSEKNYVDFLAKKVSEAAIDGGIVLLNAKDKKAIGNKVITQANSMAGGKKVSLSEETIDAKGGFVLKHGSVEINSTLETLVNGLKESVTPEVVTALFV